jgi:GST-like protein
VLEKRLVRTPYLAGEDYSIADIATYPWMITVKDFLGGVVGETLVASAATRDWLMRIGERPAVRKGMMVLEQ